MTTDLGQALLTQGGVAIITALIIGFLVKTPLRLKFNIPTAGSDRVVDPKDAAWYSWSLNLAALLIAFGFSIAAALIFVGFSGAIVLEALLLGFFAAAAAVGFSEFGSNTSLAFRK